MKAIFLMLFTLLDFNTIYADQASPAETKGGRFQIVQISSNRDDQFLIDTHTGALWNSRCILNKKGQCVFRYWNKEQIEDLNITRKQINSIQEATSEYEFGNKSIVNNMSSAYSNSNMQTCCKVCTKGKACGDACIAAWKQCRQPPGCACDSSR